MSLAVALKLLSIGLDLRFVLVQMVSCVALMIQCYLVNEDENEKINSDKSVFKLLVKLLELSIRDESYNGVRFAVIEVLEVKRCCKAAFSLRPFKARNGRRRRVAVAVPSTADFERMRTRGTASQI